MVGEFGLEDTTLLGETRSCSVLWRFFFVKSMEGLPGRLIFLILKSLATSSMTSSPVLQ